MTPMFLDMGTGEFLAIAVLVAVLFGPEKVPELAKKAGRVLAFVRRVANTATDQLKSELGPEFANLHVDDLKPSNLIGTVLTDDVQSEMNSLRAELASVRASLTQLQRDTTKQVGDVAGQVSGAATVLKTATQTGTTAVQRQVAADAPAEIIVSPASDGASRAPDVLE